MGHDEISGRIVTLKLGLWSTRGYARRNDTGVEQIIPLRFGPASDSVLCPLTMPRYQLGYV